MKRFSEYIVEAQSAQAGSDLAKRGFKFETDLIAHYTSGDKIPAEFKNICNDMDDVAREKCGMKNAVIVSRKSLKVVRTRYGGLPKADLRIEYTFDPKGNGNAEDYVTGECSFSLKTTTAKIVSVHQTSMKTFFVDLKNALNGSEMCKGKDMSVLKRGLAQFIKDGSWTTIKKWDEAKLQAFKDQYETALDAFASYVMSEGSGGTKADAVIMYRPAASVADSKYSVMSEREYLAACKEASKATKSLSGLFKFTYPHGKKGKQIQIKMPVICKKSMV